MYSIAATGLGKKKAKAKSTRATRFRNRGWSLVPFFLYSCGGLAGSFYRPACLFTSERVCWRAVVKHNSFERSGQCLPWLSCSPSSVCFRIHVFFLIVPLMLA